jgi:hypothetical protein
MNTNGKTCIVIYRIIIIGIVLANRERERAHAKISKSS